MISEEQIENQSERGNQYANIGDWTSAKRTWENIIEKLKKPAREHSAYSWLMASIGDANFHLEKFAEALTCFYEAEATADEPGNPFISLRMGQCYLRLGQEDVAVDYLLRAYMSEGVEVFNEDGPQYLKFLHSRVEL
jgi:tetratricopeptide (TPR) repeat protein